MNPKIIVFITGNPYKFQIAKIALRDSGVNIVQKKLDVPEIQDESVGKIAAFSARWASNVLNKSVAVSDSGCYREKQEWRETSLKGRVVRRGWLRGRECRVIPIQPL